MTVDTTVERLVERVWTLAGCVAELSGEPQEDVLARLLGVPAESLNRAALYRYRDDLGVVAEALAREHSRLASSTWRLLRAPAAIADIGPGGPAALFRCKIGRIEAEARDRAGTQVWSEHLDLALKVLEQMTEIGSMGPADGIADTEIVSAVCELDREFTAKHVRDVLQLLLEHGLVDRGFTPAQGLGSPQPIYTLATRHVSDYVLASTLAHRTLAEIGRTEQHPRARARVAGHRPHEAVSARARVLDEVDICKVRALGTEDGEP